MIISKKHKFIFIHIPKTAGSSLNTVLGELDPESEASTRILRAYGVPFSVANLGETSTPYKSIREDGSQALYFEKSTDFAHPYYPFNKLLCGDFLNDPSYFSFSFTRNPFDRIVSAYTYAMRRLDFEEDASNVDLNFKFDNFSDFCSKYLTQGNFCDPITRYNVHFLPQYRFLYEPQETILEDGKPLVSFVGRFEKLQEDFNYICKKIGIKNIELPRVRDQKNKKQCHEYYSKESKEIVETIYKRDLELFNYDFPKPPTKTHVTMTKENPSTFRSALKDAWTPMCQVKEIFKYANQYIPTSDPEASEKEGDTSFNSGKKIAIFNINSGQRYSVESENNALHYANKHDYTAYIYRGGEHVVAQALLNHIKDHEYILYISDSSLITNFNKKIEDLIEANQGRHFVIDESLNAILIKSHKYVENLLQKWAEGGSLLKKLKASDPSKFNHKVLSDPNFCTSPDKATNETFVLNFSNSDEEQRFFFMKMWNANHLPK